MATLNESFPQGTNSGSGPRCQDTILGGAEAQIRFEAASKQSNDPPLSRVNTLGSGEDSMKLKELMEFLTGRNGTYGKIFYLKAYISIKTYLFHPNEIFLSLPYQQCLSAKTTAWNEFSSTMAFAIICLATNQKFNFSKYIFDNMVKHLEGGVKFLMYPRFVQVFLDKQVKGMTRYKEVYVTPSYTKKVFANMKRSGKGFSGRVTPLFPTMMIQASEDMGEDLATPSDSYSTPIISQPSSSKPQKKKSRRKQRKDSGPTEPVTDEAHVSTPSYDLPQSGEDRMQLAKLMSLCTNLQEKVLDLKKAKTAQAKEITSLKKRDRSSNQHGRKIKDLDADAEVTLVDETQEMNDDNLMFDTGVLEEQGIEFEKVVEEPVKAHISSSQSQLPQVKDKGKGKMVEPEVPLKKKDQVALDEEMARNLEAQLQAELIEEERLARQKEEEANIALIKSWDNTKLSDEVVKGSETRTEESSKRAGDELEYDMSKKQKIDEHVEVQKDDQEETEMKRHIEIVKDDKVALDAIPLATKPLVIVEYKIDKDGWMGYFKLIRVDGSSKRYSSMIKNASGYDREDLETLWKLVKAKHENTRPEEDYERVIWGDLKVMFEPNIKSEVWRNLQGYKVTVWETV
ncbi:hypothetical protein Tco_1219089 [Tanacetum coccineum]